MNASARCVNGLARMGGEPDLKATTDARNAAWFALDDMPKLAFDHHGAERVELFEVDFLNAGALRNGPHAKNSVYTKSGSADRRRTVSEILSPLGNGRLSRKSLQEPNEITPAFQACTRFNVKK
jgi:hypothetical protein